MIASDIDAEESGRVVVVVPAMSPESIVTVGWVFGGSHGVEITGRM